MKLHRLLQPTYYVPIIALLTLIIIAVVKPRLKNQRPSTMRLIQLGTIGAILGLSIFLLPVIIPRIAGLAGQLRSIPPDQESLLFEGVTHFRESRSEPRPMVIHIIRIDLDAPGLEFLVTPGDPESTRLLSARTTSQFLNEFNCQLAINGDFFEPWHANSLIDYYPHPGDPVDVLGFAASQGDIYTTGLRPDLPTVYISAQNQVSFNDPVGEVYNAISGNYLIVENGVSTVEGIIQPYFIRPHPRTAIALDQSGRMFIWVIIDGRQPDYSEGATLAELAGIIIEYGGYTALNLDGGGSTALAMEGANGQSQLLNSSIDAQIPYRERPVGNHLCLYALPAQ